MGEECLLTLAVSIELLTYLADASSTLVGSCREWELVETGSVIVCGIVPNAEPTTNAMRPDRVYSRRQVAEEHRVVESDADDLRIRQAGRI